VISDAPTGLAEMILRLRKTLRNQDNHQRWYRLHLAVCVAQVGEEWRACGFGLREGPQKCDAKAIVATRVSIKGTHVDRALVPTTAVITRGC
jgi:hypothetical protein